MAGLSPLRGILRGGILRGPRRLLVLSGQARQYSRARRSTTVRLQDLPQGVLSRTDKIGGEKHAASPTEDLDLNLDQKTIPPYPTVVLQARRNMHKFANCILLTRVGGFYELYFEQAQEFGPLLNLKVASKKTNAGPVPMAGFPFFQLDRFLKILVHDHNRYVAIAEEFPNSAGDRIKSGGLLHDRRVARIVTPGTLIDEHFMDPYTNNYVMAIHPGPDVVSPSVAASATVGTVGLAWLDLSTGHFYTQPTSLPALGSVLSRVSPREIVLDERLQLEVSASSTNHHRLQHPVLAILDDDRQHHQQQVAVTFTSSPVDPPALADWAPVLESEIPPQTAHAFTDPEIAAGSLLLHYVKDRLQGLAMRLQPPVRYEGLQVMTIDKNSMRSLEIRQTLRDGLFRGSLLHAIRRTVTRSGARLLNEWLSAPSTSLDLIEARQDLVAHFCDDEDLRDGITLLLRKSCDAHRLVQKFALGRGDPDDLLDLAKTIVATDDIVGLLRHAAAADAAKYRPCLQAMVDRIHLHRPLAIAQRIRASVDEEGLLHQHEIQETEAGALLTLAEEAVQEGDAETETDTAVKVPAARKPKTLSFRDYYGEDNEAWVMKPSASSALALLHAQLADLTREREHLTEDLRSRLDAPSLVLKWSPGLGHFCHVRRPTRKKSDAEKASPAAEVGTGAGAGATTISSSRTTRSLHVPAWTALGQKLDQARFHIRAEEQRVFQDLRADVVRNLVPLRRNAAVLDELDIGTAFARLALEQNLCRPRLDRGTATAIVGGRHPTVEGGLAEQGRAFSRNDCFVRGGEKTDTNTEATSGCLWLITGPNMGGKSTFLRQNALITILAQVGCFVPADYASLGIVDALFSRVGSADNLFRDQSTFMVEMLETAHILRQATPRSFVIMDEIGRGTTPEDGTAVAFAALHHLVTVNRCRALFATHFHRLADLAAAHGMLASDTNKRGAVELYCTDVDEDGHGGFVYVHRLRKGINHHSHALKVAQLAGLPEQAIQVARDVLAQTAVPAVPAAA